VDFSQDRDGLFALGDIRGVRILASHASYVGWKCGLTAVLCRWQHRNAGLQSNSAQLCGYVDDALGLPYLVTQKKTVRVGALDECRVSEHGRMGDERRAHYAEILDEQEPGEHIELCAPEVSDRGKLARLVEPGDAPSGPIASISAFELSA
jgi:hypothetical protein